MIALVTLNEYSKINIRGDTMKTNYAWKQLEKEAPEWFKDAKFGLFFHWGPYSVPAWENEWYSRNMYANGHTQHQHHIETYGPLNEFGYKDFYDKLSDRGFDPDYWAELVIASGAKYAGPVSEHADNFSMWKSNVNPMNSVNYGIKRDVTGECFEAFKKRGIKTLSTFHHQWLWGWFMSTDPDADVYMPENEKYYGPSLPLETCRYAPYQLPDEAFNTMWLDKVKEVISNYHPDMIYFDGRTNIISEKHRYEMLNYYYTTSEDREVIMSYKLEDFPQNVGVFDVECGRFSELKPFYWQTDDRLEDNVTWCIVQNPKYKPAMTIIRQLCDVVSKNGNLLLNVGPNADGSFHPDAIKILHEIGDWLKLNGESIYGTRPYVIASEGPTLVMDENYDLEKLNAQLKEGIAKDIVSQRFSSRDFRFTRKDDSIYAIGLVWPKENVAHIKSFGFDIVDSKIISVTLVETDAQLTFTQNSSELTVVLPERQNNTDPYVIKIRV